MTSQPIRIRFRCPSCGTLIKAAESAAGKIGTCPKCQARLNIPASSVQDDSGASLAGTTVGGGSRDNTGAGMAMTVAGVRFDEDGSPAGASSQTGSNGLAGSSSPPNRNLAVPAASVRHRPAPAKSPQVIAEADSYIGKTLGKDFEVQSFLGAGGIARVYKGRQISLDRTVAIKILTGASLNTQRVARFRREAITVGRINHPNVLQVFSFGADESLCWMAMEYIDGGDVYSRITKGRIPWQTGIQWLRQTLSGLQAAHDIGVVHRDLKPQNLMITSGGTIRIADFGLVKVADDVVLTGDGKTVGTPAYINPEQALGEEVDTRADIYSLGATFYHVFSGGPVFRATSSMAVLLKHVQENPVPLEDAARDVPLPICRSINRMLDKNREHRYQTAFVALADLESYDRFGGMPQRPATEAGHTGGTGSGPTESMQAELLAPPPSGTAAGVNVNSASKFTPADSKACPYCNSTIKVSAVICRFCGESLPSGGGQYNRR